MEPNKDDEPPPKKKYKRKPVAKRKKRRIQSGTPKSEQEEQSTIAFTRANSLSLKNQNVCKPKLPTMKFMQTRPSN